MATRTHVYAMLDRERRYQDAQFGGRPHEIPSWLMLARREMEEAEEKWCRGDEEGAKAEVVQACAVLVAGLEQHGPAEEPRHTAILTRLGEETRVDRVAGTLTAGKPADDGALARSSSARAAGPRPGRRVYDARDVSARTGGSRIGAVFSVNAETGAFSVNWDDGGANTSHSASEWGRAILPIPTPPPRPLTPPTPPGGRRGR